MNESDNHEARNARLLNLYLEVTVPLVIDQIKREGGVTQEMIAELQVDTPTQLQGVEGDPYELAHREVKLPLPPNAALGYVAHRSDMLFRGDGDKKERVKARAAFARALAVMSFFPLGVTFGGNHWETKGGVV